jgi:hypothetical protein
MGVYHSEACAENHNPRKGDVEELKIISKVKQSTAYMLTCQIVKGKFYVSILSQDREHSQPGCIIGCEKLHILYIDKESGLVIQCHFITSQSQLAKENICFCLWRDLSMGLRLGPIIVWGQNAALIAPLVASRFISAAFPLPRKYMYTCCKRIKPKRLRQFTSKYI